MIRIRTGASWPHDPRLHTLRRAARAFRAEVARELFDALAIEVDGVDIAAGRAEGPLLPSLEALLHATARIVGGATQATVAFPDSEIELVIRRSGAHALLTVVALTRPTGVLARDVEVEVEALAAAALHASADFVRQLAEVLPDAAGREARSLRAAARRLRSTEAAHPRAPRPAAARALPPVPRAAPVRCALEASDEDGLLAAYEGGHPDLGSLLVAGRISLVAADGHVLFALEGLPFLALRDLGNAADALLAAARRRDARAEIPLSRAARGRAAVLAVDLLEGSVIAADGAHAPGSAPDVVRAFAEGAVEFALFARSRNPRQAENAYLVELEAAAVARMAQADELASGDLPATATTSARAPWRRGVPQRPLGPGRLRRLSFNRSWMLDVGAPAGEGLLRCGARTLVAGAAAVAAVERSTGETAWRRGGCSFAAAVGGAIVVRRGDGIAALARRTGETIWTTRTGIVPSAAILLADGPLLLVEGGAATALDLSSGRLLWRFEPPGAARIGATAFGGLAVLTADTGFVYGIDAAGGIAWRIRAPGPVARPAAAAGSLCLALAAVDYGTVLLALDPVSGARRWEAVLDLVPSAPPVPWGRRIALAGSLGGDPIIAAVERTGALAWTVAPALSGLPSVAAAGPLLAVRDASGALAALRRDGRTCWTRPARSDHAPPGSAAPAVARGTVLAPAGDGIAAVDARTGDIVGAIPGAAPARLWVDAALRVVAMDADGLATGWQLATHLSVL